MGLYLKNKTILIIPLNHTGIILKNRNTPVPVTQFIPYCISRTFYIGIKDTVYRLFIALLIRIINYSIKYLVFTVLRPRLCKNFQLNICNKTGKPMRFSFGNDLWLKKKIFYDRHLFKCQSKKHLTAHLYKLIIRNI